MKKILNQILSSKYLVYTANPEKCEPDHLFLSNADYSDCSWVSDISDADQWDTLEEAVSAMVIQLQKKGPWELEIAFLTADMTTVDSIEYADISIEARRQLIFESMSPGDLKFLADHGLG